MSDLFKQRAKSHYQRHAPLADRMRPAGLADVLGQPAITGEGSLLRAMLSNGELRSLVLWGPPGSGKTTLARILAAESKCRFEPLSATSSGVKEVRAAISVARDRMAHDGLQTLVFIDEIHRFNKAQQDSLLHAVEDGTIVLVGATTENPSFEINSAILSRCQLIVLQALDEEALNQLLDRALADHERGLGGWQVSIDDDARRTLLQYAQGDARSLLNALELSAIKVRADAASAGTAPITHLRREDVTEAIGHQALMYDRDGEEHFNLASALIKSMRGSDADAAVYYAVRMLKGGEPPRFVARRMGIFASEDIGNADPQALVLAAAALQVVELIGLPEALYTLTQLAAYLALAPKSDATKLALKAASAAVEQYGPLPVPLHLRNAPTRMMKDLGYGDDYRNPHAAADNVTGQSYLPDRLKNHLMYQPKDVGYERELAKRKARIEERRSMPPRHDE